MHSKSSESGLSALGKAEVVTAPHVSFLNGYSDMAANTHSQYTSGVKVVNSCVVVGENSEQKVVVDGEGDDYRLLLSDS